MSRRDLQYSVHSEATSNLRASVRSKPRRQALDSSEDAFIASSPPVLEPSRDTSRSAQGREGFRKFIGSRSLEVTTSATDPIVSSNPPNVRNVEQQMNGHEEDATNYCRAYNCYSNSMKTFRNSAFIYLVGLLFASIPVSAIIMGIIFVNDCPNCSILPALGATAGAVTAIFMAFWIYFIYKNRRGTLCTSQEKVGMVFLYIVVWTVTIVDACFVFPLSPSFDPASKDKYCNKTFYTFAFYKEIATAVATLLTMIIYLPGCRHTMCCYNCPARSPNQFYTSL